MNFILSFFVVAFIIYSVYLALRELNIVKFNSDNNPVPLTYNDCVDILNSNVTAKEKAFAFVSLIKGSYLYIQVQNNSGNNYNDSLQTQKFDKMLTQEAIDNLNSLEGKNGEYSF